MARRELDLPSPPEAKETAPQIGVLEETYKFLINALKCGAYNNLDARERNLIGVYFGTKAALTDLTVLAGVQSRTGVKHLIIAGLKKLWEQLPVDLKEKYPQQEAIKLKSRHIKHNSQTLAKISKAVKDKWKDDPNYRDNVMDGIQERRGKKSGKNTKGRRENSHKPENNFPKNREIPSELRDLWDAAKDEDLFEKMIAQKTLTPDQLEILKNYFEDNGQNGHGEIPSEYLLEKFSIAVANLG